MIMHDTAIAKNSSYWLQAIIRFKHQKAVQAGMKTFFPPLFSKFYLFLRRPGGCAVGQNIECCQNQVFKQLFNIVWKPNKYSGAFERRDDDKRS